LTRWNQQEFDEYMVKFNRDIKPFHPDTMEIPDEGPESTLQKKIVKWAEEKGYPCLSLKQSKNASGYIKAGWPDITLALPGKRAVWIELKAKAGILKEEQKRLSIMFMALGHEWYCIKSFKRFLEIIER